MKNKKIILLIFGIVLLTFYYFLCYNRTIISNNDNSESVTIWRKLNGECYIIPEKYFSPFNPKSNFIKTLNSASLNVVWNPTEEKSSKAFFIYSSVVETESLQNDNLVYGELQDFFLKYRGEYYDPTNKLKFNKDSIAWKKGKYEMTRFNIACSSPIYNIFPCYDD